ncbi:hypothetical protein [Clostridium sp. Marseille-Q7071]
MFYDESKLRIQRLFKDEKILFKKDSNNGSSIYWIVYNYIYFNKYCTWGSLYEYSGGQISISASDTETALNAIGYYDPIHLKYVKWMGKILQRGHGYFYKI